MCRLLGVVSRGQRSLPEIVPDELPLFTALSERHKDGWGVAWYPSGTGADRGDDPAPLAPQLRRGTDTARASNEYGDAVEGARGEVIVVHLRRASVGLALTPENTHPFVDSEVTFSHNGQFDLSAPLRERILARGGRARKAPRTRSCSSPSSPRGPRSCRRGTVESTGRSPSSTPPRSSPR